MALAECPLVLDIIGDCLSGEEQRIVEETILDEFAYSLGIVEKEEKRHTRIFRFMFCGLVLITVLLWFTQKLADEPRELIFVLFYFMGFTLQALARSEKGQLVFPHCRGGSGRKRIGGVVRTNDG